MRILPAFAVLAVAAAVLAGCSTSTASSGAPAASGAPKPATAASALDVCAAVPLAKMVALTGRTGYLHTNGGPSTDQGHDVDVCQYFDSNDASTSYQLTVAVYRNGDPATLLAGRNADLGVTTQPVSGYGDSAVASDGALDVIYGSRLVMVTDALFGSDDSVLTTAQLGKIAEAVHSAL